MAKCLDILLLGKTGVGKSATGNSILGRKAFRSSATTTSVTFKSQMEIAELEGGHRLLVVDAPGLHDTGGTQKQGEKMFDNAIKEAMLMNPEGYHVFLLLLRFGSRFTHEDLNTLEYMKKTFGPTFIESYCIVIMTGGDNFKKTLEEDDVTYETISEWCESQTGEFQILLKEVHNRILLFDNSGSAEEKKAQRQALLDMANEKMLTGRRYTNEKFEKVNKSQKKLFVEDKTILPVQRAQHEMSLILNDMEGIKSKPNIDDKLSAFAKASERNMALLKNIDEEEFKSPELKKWHIIVMDNQKRIEEEISSLQLKKKIEEQAKLNKECEIMKAFLEEEKRKIKELKQERARQNESYQNARDEYNVKKATSLWERIKSWFQ